MRYLLTWIGIDVGALALIYYKVDVVDYPSLFIFFGLFCFWMARLMMDIYSFYTVGESND